MLFAPAVDDGLPLAEALPHFLRMIAQGVDDDTEVLVICGLVAEVVLIPQALEVGGLEGAALALIPGGVGVRGVAGEIELVDGAVPRAAGAGGDDPGLEPLLLGVEELILGVGVARGAAGRPCAAGSCCAGSAP